MVLISIPAFLYADRWGRRTSAIAGGVALTFCMLVIGSLYATSSVHANSGIGRWLVIVLIFIFALSYTATWAVVGKIYASEIQPAQTRAAANSLAQGLNFVSLTAHPIINAHEIH
jgi:MFS family permease